MLFAAVDGGGGESGGIAGKVAGIIKDYFGRRWRRMAAC